MSNCTNCGAELKPSARFCAKCGAPAEAAAPSGGPESPASRPRARRSPLLRTAGLVALVLALAFGAFRLAAAPRRTTPAGTLSLLLSGLAAEDAEQALSCLDLSGLAQADARAVLETQSGDVLRSFFYAYADGSVVLLSPESRVTAVRVAASSFRYTDYDGNACALDALLRVSTPQGEYELVLSGVPSVNRDGLWLIPI